MTTEERNNLKILIEEKIGILGENIAELEELTKPIAPENAIGRVSRMDAINNRSVNEAALRQSRNKLKGLQNALRDIDKSAFGLCIRCGNPIPAGRLLLVPESRKCVNCS